MSTYAVSVLVEVEAKDMREANEKGTKLLQSLKDAGYIISDYGVTEEPKFFGGFNNQGNLP